MKLTAIVLILVTILLAMRPGIGLSLYENGAVEACCEEISCENEDDPSAYATEEDCCRDFCNPFQMCCSHIVFYDPVRLVEIEHGPKETEKNYLCRVISIHSNYAADFWQPPRLA